MNNTTVTPSHNNNNQYGVADLCLTYRNQSPTATHLFRNPPPEYFPLLGVGLFFFLISSLVLGVEVRKHSAFFKHAYFKLSSRVVMILSAFWLFAFTNVLGIVFVRGDVFLHFVANVFECACFLAFYDCVLLHCRAVGEVFDGSNNLPLRVPPCCCCLFCLPEMKTTKRNFWWLRLAIFQLIFVQTLVEFMRTLAVFDCSFDPEATQVVVFDALLTVSFLVAMWALFVVVKGRGSKLAKYKYLQKFGLFKLMILVQKFLYKLLAFLASRGHIASYKGLSGKLRCAIWTNFVAVVVSTMLLLVIRNLFVVEEYHVLNDSGNKERYAVVNEEFTGAVSIQDDASSVVG